MLEKGAAANVTEAFEGEVAKESACCRAGRRTQRKARCGDLDCAVSFLLGQLVPRQAITSNISCNVGHIPATCVDQTSCRLLTTCQMMDKIW